jgi:hypothetical protein
LVVAAALGRAVGLLWLLRVLGTAVLLGTAILGTALGRGTAVVVLVGHLYVRGKSVVVWERVNSKFDIRRKVWWRLTATSVNGRIDKGED